MVLLAMPEIASFFEQLADHAVVLDHPVRVRAEAGLALGRRLQVREDVHPRGVEPDERTASFRSGPGR